MFSPGIPATTGDRPTVAKPTPVDIVVFTVNPPELDDLRRVLALTDDARIKYDGRLYWYGSDLFRLMNSDPRRSRSARRLLLLVENTRIERGRPEDESRHPAYEQRNPTLINWAASEAPAAQVN